MVNQRLTRYTYTWVFLRHVSLVCFLLHQQQVRRIKLKVDTGAGLVTRRSWQTTVHEKGLSRSSSATAMPFKEGNSFNRLPPVLCSRRLPLNFLLLGVVLRSRPVSLCKDLILISCLELAITCNCNWLAVS
jgi:hypothetical protein